MFPIHLCVIRLSGAGAETQFLGVVRPSGAHGGGGPDGRAAVRFHLTADGVILCADAAVGESFGLQPPDLIGRAFCNLTTDVEGVTRWELQCCLWPGDHNVCGLLVCRQQRHCSAHVWPAWADGAGCSALLMCVQVCGARLQGV